MNIENYNQRQFLIWETRLPGREGTSGALYSNPEYILEIKNNFLLLYKNHLLEKKVSLEEFNSNPLSALRYFIDYVKKNSFKPFSAAGFLAYDAARYFENLPCMKSHDFLPDMYVLINSDIEQFSSNLEQDTTCDFDLYKDFLTSQNENEFIEHINKAQEYIKAGDIFQVVLSNSFSSKLQPNPLKTYNLLKNSNPSPYHYYLSFPPYSYIGASPEVFLRTNQTKNGISALMRPVAGTYQRDSAESAIRLKLDLKEQAEHLMLVDHSRNDLGKVSEIGSVEVTDLLTIENYPTLHHLVSGISCKLKPSIDILDVFQSCFPIATLTGTPKIRAMEIISELENTSRGIFGGSIFTLKEDNELDATVAIRSVLIHPQGCCVNAGAGIVYDSIPQKEFNECIIKATPVLRAIKQATLYDSYNR